MGKHGPCHHCGVASTPLWRNGPPEKPVLCNACGSRWRTKGTLVNYTPLHARPEPDEFEDYKVSKARSISINNREAKVLKRKQNQNNAVVGGVDPEYTHGFRKGLDEDTSNRSSSGSAISNSDSCVLFGSADASDLTDPAHSVVWDTMVPSRKRTCVGRLKPSSVEKLTKDLCTILHEQRSSQFSVSSEEDLLFESDTPMVSVEIGHGSILIRHPNSIVSEEESEASSLSVENKRHPPNKAYSNLAALPIDICKRKGTNLSSLGIEKCKNPTGQGLQHMQIKRDKAQQENRQIHHSSPLHDVDLKDVLNFEQFSSKLTNEEQQQLLKYLPSVDTARFPDSLKSMFASDQFKENICSFQKLHVEGVFDLSLSEVKPEDCRTLKRLTLGNLRKSTWVEKYNLLKGGKCNSINVGSIVQGGLNTISYGNSTNVKRSRDGQLQNSPGAKTTMKIPRRAMKGIYEHKELVDNDSCYFSPGSLFALPPDSSSLMLDSFQFMDEISDQDLLLNVPSNCSFPEAELLLPASSFQAQASTSSSSVQQRIRP